MDELVLVTLLHLLAFAYWLGGDVGAFYASTILTDPKQTPAARLTAAKIISGVDMAPRSALVLTLPTGISLASAKGWLEIGGAFEAAVWVAALLWLGLLWSQHLKHGAPSWLGPMDLAIRFAVLAALLAAAGAGLIDALDLPLFLSLKLLLLAACVATGLLIRRMLRPLGPALARLASGDAGPETDRAIAGALAPARFAVVAIWIALLAAAALGLWTPI